MHYTQYYTVIYVQYMEDYGGVQSIEVFGSAINDPFGRTSIYGTPHMYLYVCDSTPTTATISYTYNPLHQLPPH